MKKIRLILSASLAVLVICLGQCVASNSKQGTEVFAKAVEKLKVAKSRDDLNDAFKRFQEAYGIFDKSGNSEGRAYSMLFCGKICLSLGDYSKAIEFATKSLDLMKKIGDRKGQAMNLDNIGSAYYYTSNYNKSLEYFNQSLKIHLTSNNTEGEALTLNNIGNVYVALSEFDKARSTFSDSLVKSRRAGSSQVEAATLDTLGYIYNRLGSYQEALESHQKALKIQKAIGNVSGEGICLNNIGQVYQEYGQYSKSIEFFEMALPLLERMGDTFASGKCINNIGVSLAGMGAYSKALEYYRRALESQEKSGDLIGASGSAHNIASAYMKLGQYSKALEYYQSSFSTAKRLGNKADASTMAINMALAMSRLEKYSEAEKAFLQAIEIRHETGLPTVSARDEFVNFLLDIGNLSRAETLSQEGVLDWTLGRMALLKNDNLSAISHFERTRVGGQENDNVDLLFVGYTGLGRSHEQSGNYDLARKNYEQAVKLNEEIRSGIMPGERKNFFQVKLAGFKRSDAAKGLVRVLMKSNKPGESLAPSELTKARAFADHLYQANAAGASEIPAGMLEEEQSLVNSLAVLKREISKTDGKKQPERYANLSRDFERRSSRLDALIDTFRNKYPAYAASKYPKAFSLSESAFRPGEYVILFDVSCDGVAVNLLNEKRLVKSGFVDWNESELNEAVIKFRAPLETLGFTNFDHQLGQMIYDRLLRGVMDAIPKGAPVIIVPDGSLALLPFEALVTGGSVKWQKGAFGFPYPDGLNFLWDDHPISYYQSLTVMTLSRKYGRGDSLGNAIVVIADPVFEMNDKRAQGETGGRINSSDKDRSIDLMQTIEDSTHGKFKFNRLEGTAVLAENLGKMFGRNSLILEGMKANKSDFMTKVAPEIKKFDNLVFATHGAVSSGIPGLMEPFLALTMAPPGTDGFLKMSDILTLSMNSDVVALTACQTALGKDISGEGVLSMGRAFQYAGAKSVLMTLWEVEEASAIKLTERFFQHRKDGKSKLEALQSAREDVKKEGYRHPYFWSAFILVGETD